MAKNIHINSCTEKGTGSCGCEYPRLSAYKGIHATLDALKNKYKNGGQRDWFAFIEDTQTTVYWSVSQNAWKDVRSLNDLTAFRKGMLLLTTEEFLQPDYVSQQEYVIPGSYGVSITDGGILPDVAGESNGTLVVQYASNGGEGAMDSQDYLHTLILQDGRVFTRTGKHAQDEDGIYISWSNFTEVYATKTYVEDNYVRKDSGTTTAETLNILFDGINPDTYTVSEETPTNIIVEARASGFINLPILDTEKSLQIQIIGGSFVEINGSQYQSGETVFATLNLDGADEWVISSTNTSEIPTPVTVDNYKDVTVNKIFLNALISQQAPQSDVYILYRSGVEVSINDLVLYYPRAGHSLEHTGLYKVLSKTTAGGLYKVYTQKIASYMALDTVRVPEYMGGLVLRSLYDGGNSSTIGFKVIDCHNLVGYTEISPVAVDTGIGSFKLDEFTLSAGQKILVNNKTANKDLNGIWIKLYANTPFSTLVRIANVEFVDSVRIDGVNEAGGVVREVLQSKYIGNDASTKYYELAGSGAGESMWEDVEAEQKEVQFGYLYNNYAVSDSRKITSSDDWRVPLESDFIALKTTAGTDQGAKLKDTSADYWLDVTSHTNALKFNARGSGMRDAASESFLQYKNRFLIQSSELSSGQVILLMLIAGTGTIGITKISNPVTNGYGVRLVKVSTTLAEGAEGTYTGNDGCVYKTICIGGVEWLAENLIETKYRNGDAIATVTDSSVWSALSTGAKCAMNNDEGLAFSGTSDVSDIIAPKNDKKVHADSIVGLPSRLEEFTSDVDHRTVTDTQISTWDDKQNALGYTPEQSGVAQSLIDSLKGGVSEEGDTLYKLYALIVSSFSEINVQDTAQRNAYNVTKLPTNIFVLNDGDSKWALYKCVSTGTDRVDDVKISDPDLLNAVMTASQIKTAYESNENTNAFTDSEKEKVGNTSGVNSGDETKSTIYNKLGITQYGGIISANLDTINENNKYTAYGTATGVPSSSYSWFIDHQNSNVGTASATQRAIAYSTTLIIYERVKQGGTWGSWIKQNVLSDAFISTWNSKQSQLVSGENIKTINGNSVLGSGNIELVIPSQLNSEQSARIAGDATLDEKINQVSSGYLGFISNSDAAPTPGKNGFYEFTDDSETGPMWLDVGPIYAADKVSVVYDSINLTYTYQLIQANVNYVSKGSAETITGEKTFSVSPKVPEPVEDEDAINRKFFEENRNGLFVLLPDKCVRRLTNGSISFVSGENIVAFNNEGQYISVKPLSMTIGADSILVLSANESTYTKIDYKNITDYSELYFFCINVTNWNILDTINKNDVLFISVGGEIEFSKQSQFSTVEDINKLAVLSNITYYDSGSKCVLNIPDETFVLASSGRYAFFDEQQILVETNKAILISTTPVDYTPASKTKLKDISKLYLIIKDIADWIIFSNIDFEDILFINNNWGVFYSKINNLQKVNSKWAGKKIGFLGDSITAGTYDPASAKIERFVDKYASMTMCEAVNYGIGGTTLAEWLDGDVEGYEAMCHRYVDMANDLDVIVVEGGTNDHRGDYSTNRALPLGSFNDINVGGTLDKTFYGGLHTLMRGLKNKYPNKPIVFMTPNHYNYTGGGRVNDSDINITLLNSDGIVEEFYKPGGAPLSLYVEAIKKCASFYGLYTLNTYDILWNPAISGDLEQYTIDGIHPNSLGCKKMANVLFGFMENL